MKNTKADKEKEKKATELEAVRYAELRRTALDLSNEFDAAIYSTWYLMNPLELKHRDSIGTIEPCDEILPRSKTKKLRFTAHAHHNEPTHPSPDDMVVYASIDRKFGNFIHFIIDRFNCIRLKKK